MEPASTDQQGTKAPIALIHGLWMTPRSWEHRKERYERYHVAAPGRWIWDPFLANVQPGHHDTWVNFHNDDRAPLLLNAGGSDHVMPAAVNRSNFERCKSAAHTEYKEFEGRSHFTVGQPGWDEVADDALDWCNAHTGARVRATA